jgi:hypothetical protein
MPGCVGGRCVQKHFANTLAATIGGLPEGRPGGIWFQDEARIGQKNGRTRIREKEKGTCPSLAADQRYKIA